VLAPSEITAFSFAGSSLTYCIDIILLYVWVLYSEYLFQLQNHGTYDATKYYFEDL
jgi:hypothetical protein